VKERSLVSVIVPTSDRAPLLRGCLESLLNQDFPEDRYEIVVVDDGSSDGTADLVLAVAEEAAPKLVRYVRQERMGPAGARNTGVREAEGNPLLFVDDDMMAPPTWVRTMVEATARHPDVDCFGGRIVLQLEGTAPRLCGREPLGETELDLGDEERPAEVVWSANMAATRRAFSLAGMLDERLRSGEEMEWEHRLLQAGGKILYVPEALLWHRRLAGDLGLRRLIRNRFLRYVDLAKYYRLTGEGPAATKQLRLLPRYLGHAARRRCARGLLDASAALGLAWGRWKVRSMVMEPLAPGNGHVRPELVSAEAPTSMSMEGDR